MSSPVSHKVIVGLLRWVISAEAIFLLEALEAGVYRFFDVGVDVQCSCLFLFH
jgi:hypothetical protein